MPRVKPVSPLAKEQAKIDADCRKVHPKFDEDVAKYGRDIALFNAGFLKGDEKRKRKSKRH